MGEKTPENSRVGLENQQIPGFSDDAALVRAAFTDLLLRSSDHLGPELQRAMVEALLVDCPNDYLNQQRALVALYRDYLPKSACLNVLAEVGVSQYLASAEAAENRAFTLRTFGAEIAGQMIIDADFFSEEELSDPESLNNITQKLREMLKIRAGAAEAYGESVSTIMHHSFLGAFSFNRPGSALTTDPNSEYSKLKSAISNYTFVLKRKESLYGVCPGGGVLHKAYGDSFWVMDLPCSKVILYTDIGFKRLSQSRRLLTSNILHEAIHILLAHGIQLKIKDESGNVSLNGNLVHSDWFKEGIANVMCARFKGAFAYEYDFLDLFLQSWDGTVPMSAEILKGDTNVSYFFYTLFVAYYFQIAGMNWREWQRPEYLAEPIPINLLNLFHIFVMCSRFPIGLQQGDSEQNMSQLAIESNFEHMQNWLRHMDYRSREVNTKEGRKTIPEYGDPQTGEVLPIITFSEFCKLFDANKDKFARAWLELHASESHIQLLLQRQDMAEDPLVKKIQSKRKYVPASSIVNTDDVVVDREPISESVFDRDQLLGVLHHQVSLLETKISLYLSVAANDPKYFELSFDQIKWLFDISPKLMREKFPELPEGLWYFIKQVDAVDASTYGILPRRFYLRMISEAVSLLIQIPSEPASLERARTARLLNANADFFNDKVRENFPTSLEQHAIDFIQSFGIGVGSITYDRTFNTQLVRHLTNLHLQNLIGINCKKFGKADFIESFDGRDSLIGLFARAGDTDVESRRSDIMFTLTSLNYVYVPLESYYKKVHAGLSENVLAVIDHALFWAREHTISNTLLETERAVQLLEGMLGDDHLLHEMMHFIICRVFHVALEVNGEQYLFNAEGVMPTALHEGLANLFVSRYMISYDDIYDFTDLSNYFKTVPEILSAEEILGADTKTSYVHFTVFCGFIMQYIDAFIQNPHVDPLVFLQVPNPVSMRRGAFWFIRANRECARSQPLKVSSDFEGDVGVAYVRHVFSNLKRIVHDQHDIDIPSFNELCALFNQHKTDYWHWWKVEFAKRRLDESISGQLEKLKEVEYA